MDAIKKHKWVALFAAFLLLSGVMVTSNLIMSLVNYNPDTFLNGIAGYEFAFKAIFWFETLASLGAVSFFWFIFYLLIKRDKRMLEYFSILLIVGFAIRLVDYFLLLSFTPFLENPVEELFIIGMQFYLMWVIYKHLIAPSKAMKAYFEKQ